MANEYKIEINKRENISRQETKKLRGNGYIPGIYYSATSDESTPIYVTEKDLHEAVKSGARIFNISVNSKKQNVLFKSVQYHPVTDKILHIDLYGVKMDQAINIKVPLNLIGDAIGVKEEGGILNQPLNEIEIQCLPGDIPDHIELDISKISIGESINAGDIILDEKFTLTTNNDSVVVSVTQPMQETETEVETDEADLFLDDAKPTDEGNTDKSTNEDQNSNADQKDTNSE